MNVFTPYASPYKNAKCLDVRRRNKQILELVQLIAVNTNNYAILKQWKIIKPIVPGVKNRFQLYKSIKNHPNVKKWKGYEGYLAFYLFRLLNVYMNKSKKYHKCSRIFWDFIAYNEQIPNEIILPPWFTKESCYEHQALLISKKPEFYGPIFNKR